MKGKVIYSLQYFHCDRQFMNGAIGSAPGSCTLKHCLEFLFLLSELGDEVLVSPTFYLFTECPPSRACRGNADR